jgi:hypothetical protein
VQISAAIVFVSGPPHWEYKIRMNNSEVPSPTIGVNDLQVDVNTVPQDLYLWPAKFYRRRPPANLLDKLEKPGFMAYQASPCVSLKILCWMKLCVTCALRLGCVCLSSSCAASCGSVRDKQHKCSDAYGAKVNLVDFLCFQSRLTCLQAAFMCSTFVCMLCVMM